MARVKHCHIMPRDCPALGLRVDKVVQSMCGALPRSQIVGLFESGCIHVNGCLCVFPGQRVMTGDQIQVHYDDSQRYRPKERQRLRLGFDLVFEDRYLIVVQKPAELLTVPTHREETDTLVSRVAKYVRETTGERQVFHAHRLDREVSGLLVLGKTEPLAKALRDQFAANKPERLYQAIVAGRMVQEEGTFTSLLATDRELNRYSTDDQEIGQRAVTHYRVLRHLSDTTLVQVWLETGRRNQIRVHFAEAGHPVVGDPRYEPRLATRRNWPFRRIALHAKQLGFLHPVTRKQLKFSSPLPAEMERFLMAEEEPVQDDSNARRR
ncbi:MAG: RluA family pseudouridine synthase [Pirellulales bacterium]